MKYIIWLISSINIYLGFNCLLNVLHILQTSKYSQGATIVFAVLFLSLGIAGFYLSIFKAEYKMALIISIGPWLLSLLFLLFNMLTGDYK